MKILFLAKTKADSSFTASQSTVLCDLLVSMGHEVKAYDYSNGTLYNFNGSLTIENKCNINGLFLIHLLRYISFRRFIKMHGDEYDLVQVMYYRPEFFFFNYLFSKFRGIKLICLYGSDVNTFITIKKYFLNFLYLADYISFTTEEAKNEFLVNYRFKSTNNIVINPFPAQKLDSIINVSESNKKAFREHYGVSADCKIVVCGMSGTSNEQFYKMTQELKKINTQNIRFVFPISYGMCENEIGKFSKYVIRNLGRERVIIIDKYLTSEEVVDLRLATDILVNMRKKDQAGGAFLESLAAGSLAIVGSWLPYNYLKTKGVYFSAINDFSELAESVTIGLDLLNNEAVKMRLNLNSSIIMDEYSPVAVVRSWTSFYNSLFIRKSGKSKNE